MAGGLKHDGRGGLGLTKKVGPLPAWGWGLIVLAVLAYFLFFRRSNSGTSATVGQAETAYVPQDNSGQVNAAQAGQPSTASAPVDSLNADVLGVLQAQNSDLVTALSGALAGAYAAGSSTFGYGTGNPYQVLPYFPGPDAAPADQSSTTITAPVSTSPVSSVGAKATTTQPFGGIVKKAKLKNGSTLTTYANGRQVQQVPGQSPYVVKAGR